MIVSLFYSGKFKQVPFYEVWYIDVRCRRSYIHVGRRYAVIIGPHWFHELQRSWFEQRSQIHMCSEQNTACALLFCLFSAQFPLHLLSNGGDRGLRVRVIILLRQYGFDVCLFVCLWQVDRLFVTSRLRDESSGWRVDRVTSWLAAV